jgi:hypothetical protein
MEYFGCEDELWSLKWIVFWEFDGHIEFSLAISSTIWSFDECSPPDVIL